MRRVFSVVVGLFIAFAILSALDALDTALYPVPDVMVADRATLAGIIAGLPPAAKLIVTASWVIAPFAGAWSALRIEHWKPGGWIVTAVFLLANVANQVALPHPLWMQVCAVVLPLFGGWVAQRLHHKPYPGEPLLG